MQGPVELIAYVGAPTYARGLAYAQEGRVFIDRYDQPDPDAPAPLPGQRDRHTTHWVKGRAAGSGGRVYAVEADFRLSHHGVITAMSGWCTCPVGIDCKHAVALVVLALSESEEHTGPSEQSNAAGSGWQETLDTIFRIPEADTPLALGIEYSPPSGAASGSGAASRRLWGRSDLGTVGSVLVRPLRQGKRTPWVSTDVGWMRFQNHSVSGADPVQVDAIDRLRQLYVAGNPYDHGFSKVRVNSIDNPALWPTLRAIEEAGVRLVEEKSFSPVIVEKEPASADILIREISGEAHELGQSGALHVSAGLTHAELTSGIEPVRIGRPFHGIAWKDEGAIHLAALTHPANTQWLRLAGHKDGVVVPPGERESFERDVLPLISRVGWSSPGQSYSPSAQPEKALYCTVGLSPNGLSRAVAHWSWGPDRAGYHRALALVVDTPPQLSNTLEAEFGQIVSEIAASNAQAVRTLRSRGHQGSISPEFTERGPEAERKRSILARAAAAIEAVPMLSQGMLIPGTPYGNEKYAIRVDSVLSGLEVVTFFTALKPLLEEAGVVVDTVGETPDFVEAVAPVFDVETRPESSSRDWFDLQISLSIGEHTVAMPELLHALSRNDDALILPSGEYVLLNTPEITRLRELLGEARGLMDSRKSGIRIPRVRQSWWEDLLALGVIQASTDTWLSHVREAVENPPEVARIPHGLTATLRPYQVQGFQWLAHLRRSGLGGVLADDMGLGKTVQTLAMIMDERENASPIAPEDRVKGTADRPGPWIVVAPTSVVPNWVAEARKFTPGLRVAMVESTAKRRSVSLSEIASNVDILVTSYTLLRLEGEHYAALRPRGIVLDEAQQAKNPASKTFTSIAALGAPCVFAITGTPMENNLGELWAMFALTAPGLLGSAKQFDKSTRKPIEKGEDDGTRMALLRRRIAPFILRRSKAEVASDLPEKQEQILSIELSAAHKKVYERYLNRERQRILRLADDMDSNRVQVLAALTRLRQLAIDPDLVEDPSDDTSETHRPRSSTLHSKLDALVPLLAEAAGEGHRVLVFSQFTRYLRMIAQRLNRERLSYAYLDGTTKNRAEVIRGFAEGTDPVFLISLKAGGVGLNLTMADYVVLTDPWWNPAVEEQAVDRTHRIGQVRSVHVYRLVSQGTIEEKVLALQESKRELVASVLSSDSEVRHSGGVRLSSDDLHLLLS